MFETEIQLYASAVTINEGLHNRNWAIEAGVGIHEVGKEGEEEDMLGVVGTHYDVEV